MQLIVSKPKRFRAFQKLRGWLWTFRFRFHLHFSQARLARRARERLGTTGRRTKQRQLQLQGQRRQAHGPELYSLYLSTCRFISTTTTTAQFSLSQLALSWKFYYSYSYFPSLPLTTLFSTAIKPASRLFFSSACCSPFFPLLSHTLSLCHFSLTPTPPLRPVRKYLECLLPRNNNTVPPLAP